MHTLDNIFLYVYSFVSDLSEDALNGPKRVGGSSEGSK